MTDPLFLSLEEVLELHADQLRLFGGTAGIRDKGALESAIAVPFATFGGEFLHTCLFEMAAATRSTSPKTSRSSTATSGLGSTPA